MTGMAILGHGLDIVEVARIAEMLDRHGEQFLRRCFTDAERGYADSGPKRRAERYASRFACKEAVLKALGTGWRNGIAWTDIDVRRAPSGQPVLRLSGRCAELADELGIRAWHVSMSHTEAYATASAIAWGADVTPTTPRSADRADRHGG
jgi:holo-[acyl-carrier protein] synthase